MVQDGKLSLISGPRGSIVPSHVLYADDVMLFFRGSKINLQELMPLFSRYGNASGQIINPSKSTFYSGSISLRRQATIANTLGFAIGKFPFTYFSKSTFYSGYTTF